MAPATACARKDSGSRSSIALNNSSRCLAGSLSCRCRLSRCIAFSDGRLGRVGTRADRDFATERAGSIGASAAARKDSEGEHTKSDHDGDEAASLHVSNNLFSGDRCPQMTNQGYHGSPHARRRLTDRANALTLQVWMTQTDAYSTDYRMSCPS